MGRDKGRKIIRHNNDTRTPYLKKIKMKEHYRKKKGHWVTAGHINVQTLFGSTNNLYKICYILEPMSYAWSLQNLQINSSLLYSKITPKNKKC